MTESEVADLTTKAKERISAGEYSDAEYFFKQITKIDPNNWQAWYGRGLCFKRLLSYERAIYCFDQVSKINPEFAKGWYNLGFCQSQIGLLEDAIFHLNRSLKIDASFSIAMVIKAWIFKEHDNNVGAAKMIKHVRENYPEFLVKLENKTVSDEAVDFQIAYQLLLEDNSQ